MVMRRVLGLGLALSLLLVPQVGVGQTMDEFFERGNTARREGRYEEAERTWQRLLQIDPNHANNACYTSDTEEGEQPFAPTDIYGMTSENWDKLGIPISAYDL
ncbi:tetratricopeptide repeat protein [Sodalinema gerasimenkoae]|uniref:tetratricopeptide repeat protein n=1 Tax=Sodalinema gerasimenkoae TaxID=2862348 RepID=UPI0013585715|nr:tetratricopeptide repeat protein [Sodalinema gerasimenkoae]